MAKAKKTVKTKIIKKRWVSLIAPKTFNSQMIGETHVPNAQLTMGKSVSISLANLTGDMKRQNILISFVVDKVGDDKAYTTITGYNMSTSSVKRLVRRSKNKIDQSIIIPTKDGRKLKVKVVMLTRGETNKSVLTALRKASEEELSKTAKKMDFETFTNEVISHKVQSNLKRVLAKIYPLQIFEIRHLSAVKEVKHAGKKVSEKIIVEEPLEVVNAEENVDVEVNEELNDTEAKVEE